MSIAAQDRRLQERGTREPVSQGRPRRGRPARAHILMVLAGLLTAVAVYVVLADADPGQRVLAAASELRAGTVVPPDALVAVTVDVGADQAARLIPADQIDAMVGQVVTNHLLPGDIVGRSDLRQAAAPEDRRAIALPLPRERAVAGDLRTGDRVDVIAVEEGLARYVATGLPVLASGDGGDSLDAAGWSLTVSVDEQDALALARALSTADVMVTRATGATPADRDAIEGGLPLLGGDASGDDASGDGARGDDGGSGRGGRASGGARDSAAESSDDDGDDGGSDDGEAGSN